MNIITIGSSFLNSERPDKKLITKIKFDVIEGEFKFPEITTPLKGECEIVFNPPAHSTFDEILQLFEGKGTISKFELTYTTPLVFTEESFKLNC